MENQGTTKVVKVNLPGGSQETATKVAGTGKGVIGHEEKTNRQVAKDTKVNNLPSLSTQRAGTNYFILSLFGQIINTFNYPLRRKRRGNREWRLNAGTKETQNRSPDQGA